MIDAMKERYFAYYRPLVQDFCRELLAAEHDGWEHMPQPFLPLFGPGYEKSALRIAFIGQDTAGWPPVNAFVRGEVEAPGSMLREIFQKIEDREFTKWGKNTHSFWGFAMAMLAQIHGIPNWNVLKWGGHEEILGSFAWANVNAVELWGSLRKYSDAVPEATWAAARAAGARFDRFSHLVATLAPRVVVLVVKSVNRDQYFEGFRLMEITSPDAAVRHYRVEGYDIDIFHTYHPGYMRNVGGPWSFLNRLREMLAGLNLEPDFPEFIDDSETAVSAVRHLMKSAPRPDGNNERKYECVTWIAKRLCEEGSFMSVPRLAEIMNELGYTTNCGAPFEGGRGSYRLVRGAYHRNWDAGDEGSAAQVAEAFRKPNFSYAY